MKRVGIILLCMMLVTSCIIVVFPVETVKASSNILYVGGSGPGNYTTIQSAIDTASGGDTVFVYDDSSPYYENVLIDKPINLIGENNISTIIDGSGINSIMNITSNHVHISSFTIQNSGYDWWPNCYGILAKKSSYSIIENCLIFNCDTGMHLSNFNNSVIRNNLFNYERFGGLVLFNSVNTTLKENTFLSQWGIFVDGSYELEFNHTIDQTNIVNGVSVYYFYNIHDHVFSGLNITHLTIAVGSNITIENSSVSNGDGLHLAYVNNSTISRNNLNHNYLIGLLFLNSTNNLIENNNVKSNNRTGIDSAYSSNNIYRNNTIANNSYLGIAMCLYGRYNEISGNDIYNNLYGIYLGQSASTGIAGNHHNIINNNRIYDNRYAGVVIYKSHDNFAFNNTIFDNQIYGINLNESNSNTINHNNLMRNSQNAFDNLKNQWNSNYYDDWIGLRLKFLRFLPYRIPGTCFSNLDWHPAKQPYDIP